MLELNVLKTYNDLYKGRIVGKEILFKIKIINFAHIFYFVWFPLVSLNTANFIDATAGYSCASYFVVKWVDMSYADIL